jgi:hypothetical protein
MLACSSVQSELDLFLNDAGHDISFLRRYPIVKELFILKNTSLLSNALASDFSALAGRFLRHIETA